MINIWGKDDIVMDEKRETKMNFKLSKSNMSNINAFQLKRQILMRIVPAISQQMTNDI